MVRLAALLAVFSAAFGVWVLAFGIAGRAGFPAAALLDGDCFRPKFALAGQALNWRNVPDDPVLVVGNLAFRDKVTDAAHSRAQDMVFVRLPGAEPHDYAAAINLFSEFNPSVVLLQSAPRLWLNIQNPHGFADQNTQAADLMRSSRAGRHLLMDARRNIRTVTEILGSDCVEDGGTVELVDRVLWAQLRPDDILAKRALAFRSLVDKALSPATPIVWVFDPEDIPRDALPETNAALRDFAGRNGAVEGWGAFAPISALGAVLAN
ncbi:MAG: hypothetical protein AAGF74_03495 [Pseudomonadota bacterium]